MKTILLSLLFVFAYSVHAQVAQLEPLDESTLDATFATFKARLMKAIKEKDPAEIKKMLATDVGFSFGVNEQKSAIEGFSLHYKLTDKKSDFWSRLEQTINLGCVGNSANFSCPYLYANWPAEYDSTEHIVVIKKDVFVREKPFMKSKKVQPAGFGIFKLAPEQKSKDWNAVTLTDKSVGFIRKSMVRSATDYRVIFQKISGEWKIKYFIAGD